MVHTQLGVHLLEAGVVPFEFGQTAFLLLTVLLVTLFLFVESGRTDMMLTIQLGYAGAGIVLGQDRLLLGFIESALTHGAVSKGEVKLKPNSTNSMVAAMGKPTPHRSPKTLLSA